MRCFQRVKGQEAGQGEEWKVLRKPVVPEFLTRSGFRETISGQGYTRARYAGQKSVASRRGEIKINRKRRLQRSWRWGNVQSQLTPESSQ